MCNNKGTYFFFLLSISGLSLSIVFAMTNGGPGQSTWVPAYFTINAYWVKANLGLASAAACVMMGLTLAIFLPLVLLTTWQQKRQEARAQ